MANKIKALANCRASRSKVKSLKKGKDYSVPDQVSSEDAKALLGMRRAESVEGEQQGDKS